MGTHPTTRKTNMDQLINITFGTLLIYVGAVIALRRIP
jgi:threonine/homoserine/homoserine lactone efflux protein